MKKHSWSARLRYAFDNYMSRGTIALILGLFVLSLLIIVVVTIVLLVSGTLRESLATEGIDFAELFWLSLLRTLDPGTMAGDAGSVPFVLSMLVVTLGGIFVISTLIAVISSGIQNKLDDLRKGRSQVLESGHTVILGWSAQVFEVIAQIVEANANKRNQAIVVLAERDKVDMEDAIRERVADWRTTRIVCRSGSPIELSDLDIVGLSSARSVIVLSPEIDDPDSSLIKTLLAIANQAGSLRERHVVVAEVRDPRNLDVARLASGGGARLVVGSELIGRITAQTCRQPGLSAVYMDLLDFAGDEIYFSSDETLVNRPFGEALLEFRASCLVGINPAESAPLLNPPMDRRISAGDQLIFIAHDDDAIAGGEPRSGPLGEDLIVMREHDPVVHDATLVLGWNSRTPGLLLELDRYVADGSRLTVIGAGPAVEDEVEAVKQRLQRLRLDYRAADTTDRDVLDSVVAEGYDHIVVMSHSDVLDTQRADGRTLVTLLHLREIAARHPVSFTIVSEMLDLRNLALAQAARADDFIVSSRLVSLVMSQLAENPQLAAVFDELFDERGAEIYLQPAADYVRLGVAVDFYTVVESARRRGETAIGYRLSASAGDPTAHFGVVLNPDKVQAIRFTRGDRMIVLAQG